MRGRSLETYVEGNCESACTLIFLAGKSRGATPNAKIGFHRATFAGEDDKGLDPTNPMIAAYRKAGISDEFLRRVIGTASSSIWYPTRDELIANHVVNRVSLGGETVSDLGRGVKSATDLRDLLIETGLFASIEARFPGSLDRAAAVAWKARQSGGNDDQMYLAARGVIVELAPRS